MDGFELRTGPGAAAKVGVEGSVSLGKIAFPLEAGAGLTVGAEPDTRPAASDIDPTYVRVDTTTHLPLIPMKRYSIHGVYKYGGGMELTKLLDGAIDVAVKLEFPFFSKKFRARIIEFTGLCNPAHPESFCNVDLFGGYGNIREIEIPLETIKWGSALMPSAFFQLAKFEPGTFPPAGGESFDPGRAGKLFYEELCHCIENIDDLGMNEEPETCTRNADCCGYPDGDFCFTDPEDNEAKCTNCREDGESCRRGSTDCCDSDVVKMICFDDPDAMMHPETWPTCMPQRECDESCGDTSDCEQRPTQEIESARPARASSRPAAV